MWAQPPHRSDRNVAPRASPDTSPRRGWRVVATRPVDPGETVHRKGQDPHVVRPSFKRRRARTGDNRCDRRPKLGVSQRKEVFLTCPSYRHPRFPIRRTSQPVITGSSPLTKDPHPITTPSLALTELHIQGGTSPKRSSDNANPSSPARNVRRERDCSSHRPLRVNPDWQRPGEASDLTATRRAGRARPIAARRRSDIAQ